MRYNYRTGITRDKKRPLWVVWLLVLVLLGAAAYFAANFVAPQLISMPLSDKSTPDATMQKLQATPPGQDSHLYIPQINIDVPVAFDPAEAKQNAAKRHKDADTITPDKQGELALCAQRFTLGATPWHSRELSPFYNLDKLQNGDEFYIDYDSQRYAYKVSDIHSVTADVEVAEDGAEKTLKLYACNQSGESEQFVVVEAKQVGVVASEKTQSDTIDPWWQ